MTCKDPTATRATVARRAGAPALLAVLLIACAQPEPLAAEEVVSERHIFSVETVAHGLEHPWGLAFLPNGDMLVTEREGRLRLIRNGELDPQPVGGLPEVVANGQGGLLDVALHPDFAENRLLYLSYAGPGDGGAGTEVARARYDDGQLQDLETLLVVEPKSRGGRHFGSRLVFGPDGQLYVTSGDRGSPERAQDMNDLAGSVLRIADDGAVPSDNPFAGEAGAAPEIYSSGHRNPQGLAWRPGTDEIWAIEHGPRGGDELNLLSAGTNYGWPIITYGRSYAGFSIGEGSEKPGLAQPAHYWVPSISPSGLAFYDGEAFPEWQGNLFLGALSDPALVRLELDGQAVVYEERLLTELGERIRDVRQGPDGLIYLLTDSPDGAVLRLEPAE